MRSKTVIQRMYKDAKEYSHITEYNRGYFKCLQDILEIG